MKTRNRFFKQVFKMFLFSVIVFAFTGIVFLNASASESKLYDYLRIFYFRDGGLARESLFAHPDSIDVLASAVGRVFTEFSQSTKFP